MESLSVKELKDINAGAMFPLMPNPLLPKESYESFLKGLKDGYNN